MLHYVGGRFRDTQTDLSGLRLIKAVRLRQLDGRAPRSADFTPLADLKINLG
jgi:hypothetical protein